MVVAAAATSSVASSSLHLTIYTTRWCLTRTGGNRLAGARGMTTSRVVPAAGRMTGMRSAATPTGHYQWRNFMSTQAMASPEEESHMMLILGKPGGGKGTISGKILQDFPRFHHVSTGDLLRQHVREKTSLGLQAKAYMDQGELVPDSIMIKLVMEDATPYLEAGKSLLMDGYPRNLQQARALEEVAHIDMVINLDIPTETIVERIADRWIHPASGRIYSYSYKPPQRPGYDDVTGEPLVQREDDKPESVRRRLEAYDKVTAPLVRWYEKKGLLKTFQGTKSDVIYENVKAWLEDKHC